LYALLKEGQRAILCDLTNALRYGDIVAEQFKLPFLIEVKTSHNENARTSRQIKELGDMAQYLRSDETTGLYGFTGTIKRIALPKRQKQYNHVLFEMINEARETDFCSREVERGLHFIVFRKFNETLFEKYFGPKRQQIHLQVLNFAKYSGAWTPFLPFVISIENVEQCFSFAVGEFLIAVAVDFEQAARMAKRRGYVLTPEKPSHVKVPNNEDPNSGDWAWWFTQINPSIGEKPEYFAVGPYMIGRVFFEFSSLKWLIDVSVAQASAVLPYVAQKKANKEITESD
jgi:hypothetical protein